MPAFPAVNYVVTSVEIGGGKAVVEMKSARATLTYELAEDSGWLKYLTEGAAVRESVEVTQLGAPVADQITTIAAMNPEPVSMQQAAVPHPEMANLQMDGPDGIKDLLGIGGGTFDPNAPRTGTISRA